MIIVLYGLFPEQFLHFTDVFKFGHFHICSSGTVPRMDHSHASESALLVWYLKPSWTFQI
jgi:hypothetical protein